MRFDEPEETTISLWDDNNKREIVLKKKGTGESYSFVLTNSFVLGRVRESCDMQIAADDRCISRRHARFFMGEDGVYVEDLGSRNGTRLNGKTIFSGTKIRRGDILGMGKSEFEIIL